MSKAASKNGEMEGRGVRLFIGSKAHLLLGNWQWDLNCDTVFCSDVMLFLSSDFSGTRGIIHPDDLQRIKESIGAFAKAKIISIQFRIITTYGEVKTLHGKQISLADEVAPPQLLSDLLIREFRILDLEKEVERHRIRKEIWDNAERLNETGTWYFNTSTHAAWYSDNVYRIYGIPPQGLNAHLHTFTPFIHPDDRVTVIDAFDKAYKEQVPLHIEFRIICPDGKEKYVHQTTRWSYTSNGERIITGIIKDETEAKAQEAKLEFVENELHFQKQFVQMDEKVAGMGHWYANPLTRKVVFSENCYRIHGLKTTQVVSGLDTFIHFVHTDDQQRVSQAYKKLREDHALPEMEFRIIRHDGKVRFIRQQGKAIVYAGEVVVIGFMQDVTIQKLLEKNLQDLKESASLYKFSGIQTENMAGMGSWLWEIQSGKIIWSDGAYNLLGHRPGTGELTQKQLLQLIHVDDRKLFSQELVSVLSDQKETDFEFRLMRSGVVRHIKASFRLMRYDGKNFFIAAMQDITGEYEMRRQLKERIQLTELFTENILDRAVITDINNTIVLWNKQCEDIYKIKKEVAIGKNFFDVFPHLKNEEHLSLFNTVLKGEIVQEHYAKSLLHNEYYDLHMIPLKNEQGEVFGIMHLVHDVTKEQQLQQSLAERLHFIESLVEASVDRIIVLDTDMNYLIWNKRCEEYYGLSKRQVLGKNVLEVFPDTINDASYSDFKRTLRGETVYIPVQEDSIDGHYNEVYLVPVKNEKGNVIAVLWMLHDLTNEYLLIKEQRKANAILDTINEACFELDTAETIIYVNRKATEFWNKSREELLHKNVWEAFPAGIGTPSYFAIKHALKERTTIQHEAFSPILHRWIYIKVTPSESGAVILFYDVHDAKEAQNKLMDEHRRLKEAQGIGHVGSFEWDPSLSTIYWSDELYRIHGLEPQSEVITLERLWKFIHPDDLLQVQEMVVASTQAPFTASVTYRILREDGEVRIVSLQVQNAVDADKMITNVSGTAQDITEQVQAREQLKQSRDLLQSLFDASPSSISVYRAVYDIDGQVEDFEIVMVNQFTIAIVGGTDPIGKQLTKQFPTVLTNGVFGNYKNVFLTGKPIDFEVWYEGEGMHNWFRMIVNKVYDLLVVMTEDITDRKKSEEETKKHLAILQQSEDLAEMGSWEYDIATGIFQWSEGMYRLFDLPRGVEVKPEIYVDFAMEEDRNIASRIVQNLKKNFSSFDEVLRIKGENAPRILKIRGTVITNEKQEPQKVVGVDLDITGIKVAEERMEESEDLLQQTTWATPDAINIYDLEQKQSIHLNNCLADWIGLQRADLTEMGYKGRLQLLHPDDRERLDAFNNSMYTAADDETRTIEYRLQTPAGKTLWIRDRSKIFKRDKEGKPTHILSVLQDFTQEVELRRQLSERSRFVERLFDASIDRMFVLDKDLIIQAWNKKCEEYYSKRRDEVIGRSYIDAFPRMAESAEVMNALQMAFSGEQTHVSARKEIYINTITERFYVPLFTGEGEVSAVLCVLHDVTRAFQSKEELKELNRTLEQKNKELEEKNEEISSFAFIASHDLKEPLRKLYTFSDWLLQKEAGGLSETGKTYIKKIANSVRRMDMLIEDVLVLAKIGSDKRPPQKINLNAVLQRVTGELKDYIKQKEAEVNAGHLPIITGNDNQVFYLFKNLLSNAIKFQLPGNQPLIKITAGQVDSSQILSERLTGVNDYYKISFEDNGMGFEMKYAKKIFQVFQRLHTKVEYEGTGMGLAICRKIMENHAGFIRVESEPGKGSIFSCYFPIT